MGHNGAEYLALSSACGDQAPSAVYILMVLTATALVCVVGYFFLLKLVPAQKYIWSQNLFAGRIATGD
jgi:hypothetical protein